MVDHLSASVSKRDVAIAHVHCDYKQRYRTVIRLISSLIAQLASHLQHIPYELQRFYSHQREDKASRARLTNSCTIEKLEAILLSIVREFNSVFILVDALDELRDHGSNGETARTQLLQILENVSSQCKVLVTSRPYLNPHSLYFQNAPVIEIFAHADDIRTHVESSIDQSPTLCRFTDRDPLLRQEIVSSIFERAQGM